jgi:hypothetical protein
MKQPNSMLVLTIISALFCACTGLAQTDARGKTPDRTGKAVVYFTRVICPSALVKLYDKINQDIGGKVARRDVFHRKRFSYGWRSHLFIVVWGACPVRTNFRFMVGKLLSSDF